MRTKEASIALRFLAAVLSSGAQAAESAHTDQFVAEASLMNERLRAFEHARMQPVRDGFKGASNEVADRIGRAFAHRLEKDANILSGAFKAVSGLGKKTLGGLPKPGVTPIPAVTGGATSTPGLLTRLSPNARFNAAAKTEGLISPTGAAPTTVPSAPVPKSKPLLGWKSKAAIGGGLALTGYAGYKGLQTAKDYMMMPSQGGAAWGHGGPQPFTGINQFGQPQ